MARRCSRAHVVWSSAPPPVCSGAGLGQLEVITRVGDPSARAAVSSAAPPHSWSLRRLTNAMDAVGGGGMLDDDAIAAIEGARRGASCSRSMTAADSPSCPRPRPTRKTSSLEGFVSGSSQDELADMLLATAALLGEVAPRHALMGGAADMVYGERARTRGVDFLVDFHGSERGQLEARPALRGLRGERKAPWHLRLWRREQYADVITAEVELQRSAVASARELELPFGAVRIVDVEHLVALTVLAGRPRDMQDVDNVMQLHPELDRARVRALLALWGLSLPVAPRR